MDVRVLLYHSAVLPLGIKLEELAGIGGDIPFVVVNYK